MSKASGSIDVSVVMPCLDEARTVGVCVTKAIESLTREGCCCEVVVCDNQSQDGSAVVAAGAGARVVHEPRRGYGHALRTGIIEARGRFVILGDADDTYDFGECGAFVGKWREGYDLVMGSRLKGRILPGAMPWLHRWVGVPVLTTILNWLFGARVSDAHCGMRGITRESYERLDLRTTGMEFASEMIIKAARSKMRIAEVPIAYYPDKRGGASHLRTFRDGWRHLRFMLMLSATHLFIVPGSALVTAGLVVMLALSTGPIQILGVSANIGAMTCGLIATLLGLHILSVGLFAKVFSYTEHLGGAQRGLERYLRHMTLESGLLLGVGLGVVGAAMAAGAVLGARTDIRLLILAAALGLSGVHVIFSSFFLSMLGISRETYAGDYDIRRSGGQELRVRPGDELDA